MAGRVETAVDGDCLAGQLDRIRAELAALAAGFGTCSAGDVLGFLLAVQRLRDRHFRGVSDAGWRMILDLAASARAGQEAYVTGLCVATGIAPTSALRHLDRLVDRGLVERRAAGDDGRRTFVELTAKGSGAMADLLDAARRLCPRAAGELV